MVELETGRFLCNFWKIHHLFTETYHWNKWRTRCNGYNKISKEEKLQLHIFPKNIIQDFCLAKQAASLRGKEGMDWSKKKTWALHNQTNCRASPEGRVHGNPTSNIQSN